MLVTPGNLMGPLKRKAGPSGPPIFLPQAGPFFDQAPINANLLPNLTVSGIVNAGTSRRSTPLKYNTVTINESALWRSTTADSCLFLWCNHLILNGVMATFRTELNGSDGNEDFGGSGGSGAVAGGGGGGSPAGGCETTSGGSSGSPFSPNGSAGEDGVTPGGPGGIGASTNWVSDGYDYSNDLTADPDSPFIPGDPAVTSATSGDQGGSVCCGAITFSGGGGGSSCGMMVVVANLITSSGGSPFVEAAGGDGGLDSNNFCGGGQADGGGGGCVLYYSKAYPSAFLDGQVDVSGGNGATTSGAMVMYQINGDLSIISRGFGTIF